MVEQRLHLRFRTVRKRWAASPETTQLLRGRGSQNPRPFFRRDSDADGGASLESQFPGDAAEKVVAAEIVGKVILAVRYHRRASGRVVVGVDAGQSAGIEGSQEIGRGLEAVQQDVIDDNRALPISAGPWWGCALADAS